MSLIMIEGFETRGLKTGWAGGSYVTGRFGGYASTSNLSYTLPTPADEIVVGYALRSSSTGTMFEVRIGTGVGNLRLDLSTGMILTLLRYQTVLTQTASPVAEINQWVYIEIMTKIAEVGGYCQVRVNGTTVIDYVGDTQHNVAEDPRVVQLYWAGGSTNHIDDVYVCDRSGGDFNDFLSEVQVLTLNPTGNGTFSQLVGSDGNSTNNYQLVDELPGVDTDNVGSATVGDRDTYAFSDPTVPGQYLAVQPSAQIAKLVAGDASVRLIQRLASGSERESDSFVASNLRWVSPIPSTRDPEGAVWTMESIATSEFGIEVS